ncbi:hypothetical protein JXB28_00325 [Candidatus Woesearchaeota archaeon]|nr:hypothetical protein [Candidatus Woesearchaeota archaeon]
MGVGELILLGLFLFVLIKVIKGKKMTLGKWLIIGLLLVIFFPGLAFLLTLIGIALGVAGAFAFILLMVLVACLAMLFS